MSAPVRVGAVRVGARVGHGRDGLPPAPRVAAGVGLHAEDLATPQARTHAALLDLGLLVVTVVAASGLGRGPASPGGETGMLGIGLVLGILIVPAVAQLIMLTGATTLGKRAFGLRVVRPDGRPVSFGRMLVRETLGKAMSAAVLFLGFVGVVAAADRRGWHDKLVDGYVVDRCGPSRPTPSADVGHGRRATGQRPRPEPRPGRAGPHRLPSLGCHGGHASAGAPGRVDRQPFCAPWSAAAWCPGEKARWSL